MSDMNVLNVPVLDAFPEDISNEFVSEMVTVNDAVRYAASYLIESGVFLGHGTQSCWDEAMYLVMCAINLDPPADAETLETRLTVREKGNIAKLLMSRVRDRIPAAYLTGRAWFSGLEFYVDPRVLIPRSPIAEMIQASFKPYLKHYPRRILDMCTGSGCIAIACADMYRKGTTIDAVDISDDALEVCSINIASYGLEDVVYPYKSDLFSAIPDDERYDLIVCNPPYVDSVDLENMPEEYRHEPRLALEAGDDGLSVVKRLLASASYYMNENSILVCEVGNSRAALEEEFPEVPFHWVTFKNGGEGVFVLTYDELIEFAEMFSVYNRRNDDNAPGAEAGKAPEENS